MKDWEYTFDAVSKEQWIRQIESDLKQKPISSLEKEWWQGELLSPLVHGEDITTEVIRLPDSLFDHPPLITEIIETTDVSPSVVNQRVLKSLQHGAQYIIVNSSLTEKFTPEQWFEGVNREIVTLAFQPEDSNWESIFFLNKNLPNHTQLRIVRQANPIPFKDQIEALSLGQKGLDKVRFIYEFPSSGLWDIQTAQILNALSSDLKTWMESGLEAHAFFSQCILLQEADPSYFKHIIQSRVLHVIWQNLIQLHAIHSDAYNQNYLECHVRQNEGEEPAPFLIRASMSALAASLTGTQGLCIHHADHPESENYFERNNRNLHHLLNLESGMYKGKDPLAGAYALDYHTASWTKSIWRKMSFEQ